MNPDKLLNSVEGGNQVVYMDSNRDLPKDWKTIDISEKYDHMLKSKDEDSEDDDNDVSFVPPDKVDSNSDEASQNEDEDSSRLPKRVLLFTTMNLLGTLALSAKASVDGTFKSMTKKWKQLFILTVKYRGEYIPTVFGWLPDKSKHSYSCLLYTSPSPRD